MPETSESLALLRRIAFAVERLAGATNGHGSAAPLIADDRDLDSEYGNPVIKAKDPRDWTGEPMQGRRFSECPAEYLDLLADRLDYFARKADEGNEQTSTGKPVAPYRRKEAARARGWARRIRDGKVAPYEAPAASEPTTTDAAVWDSEIPF